MRDPFPPDCRFDAVSYFGIGNRRAREEEADGDKIILVGGPCLDLEQGGGTATLLLRLCRVVSIYSCKKTPVLEEKGVRLGLASGGAYWTFYNSRGRKGYGRREYYYP